MSEPRFQSDLIVIKVDFEKSGWQEAIANASEHSYSSYWQSFSKAAQNATGESDEAKRKVLWLLADACSMMLKPKSNHSPFRPYSTMPGARSAIPEDFSDSDIVFFESILPKVDDFRLKARLADILWIINQPKNIQHAYIAIETYQLFPLDFESLLRDGKVAWERAIRTALMLGSGAKDKVKIIWNILYEKLYGFKSVENAYGLFLSDLLKIIPLEKDKFKNISDKLEGFANKFNEDKNFHLSRSYYERAIDWAKLLKNQDEICRLTVQIAESFVSEATVRTQGDKPSYLAAGKFLEDAIHTYRKIPNDKRQTYNVEERLKELLAQMKETNKLAVGEMSEISTEAIDLSSIVENSQKLVRNKKFPEVLLFLSNVASEIEADKVRKDAETNIQQYPLHTLFSSTHMTQEGRVAARSPGLDPNDLNSEDSQKAIWAKMIQHYGILIGITVQGYILPALQIVNLEHRLTEEDLFRFCQESRAIPNNREELWAKGLYFGFEHDFISSTHLLAPQVEHFVRTQMKQSGLKTTALDSKGIETENGLSALMDHPDIDKVFDQNLAFELKALLADSLGSNLRNKVAHGLLEAEEAMSSYGVYFWWLCLRLVINTIQRKPIDTDEEATK